MSDIEYFHRKQDSGKLRMDLIPSLSLEALAAVLTYGAQKYADNSWQTVPDALKRYKAAMLRHYVAMNNGELVDVESGQYHSAHMMCNAMFVDWLLRNG